MYKDFLKLTQNVIYFESVTFEEKNFLYFEPFFPTLVFASKKWKNPLLRDEIFTPKIDHFGDLFQEITF